ncbi:Leu/Phe/Val dehydrogenase [Deinococcus peraridilitoris]|uniref:Glutamate dehydrogenase/leucine dehydrogenase n=1 Tax=Deinococcus peraridilitoris (strain DSM 19664 / LMG 22246 / CIP 109416 / KR-200) TaxID=937777 RepID=K9ZXT5_DEIPD|nr:Glu/Leu/Phe/Val dehydrogenase dimerization domain-containing protein [Deinococcus peraridilitoris]AFZ66411.1 glutamate dehydrogenase/leucine dehydrogenase [Deinococcus peraridilitoris DSM 19664]
MLMFQEIQARGHEQVTVVHHAPSGLRAVIAVHSSVLGPAIAGCRLMPYEEDRALRDALALSESLTYKAALAGLNLGGGACILLAPEGGDFELHGREALFRALGRQVRLLGGRLVLTEDVGVVGNDIAYAAQETSHTLGMNTDTPAVTAYGVYRGMKAAARYHLGGESMRGVRVAILGAGSVGRALATHLLREGAKITVADLKPEKAALLAEDLEGPITVTNADAIFDAPCDIFSPCGFGHSIRSPNVPRLQAKMIAGGEHNPLTPRGQALLKEAGIVYIPDFAINAAGLIAASSGASAEEAAERVYQNVLHLNLQSSRTGRAPHEVARELAAHRIRLIGSLGSMSNER